MISFSSGTGRKEIAILSSTELVTTPPVSNVSFTSYEAAFGNGFFDVIGKIAKGVVSVLGMIPNPITEGIISVTSTVGYFLERPKPNAPVIQVANPAKLTAKLKRRGF